MPAVQPIVEEPTVTDTETIRVPVPGGELAVDLTGPPRSSVPVVVLVHGGTSTAAMDWDPIRPTLASRFHVVAFDHRGHGRSGPMHPDMGIAMFADDITAVMAHLDVARAALVGCSVGAHASLVLAGRRPAQVAALVTIGACRRGDPDRIRGLVDGPWPADLVALEHAAAEDDDHWHRVREVLVRDWARNHDLTDADLRAVGCPTLVVHGEHDRVQPPSEAIAMAAAIPDARVLVVEGAGHMAQVDRPEVVGPAIADFLTDALARAHTA